MSNQQGTTSGSPMVLRMRCNGKAVKKLKRGPTSGIVKKFNEWIPVAKSQQFTADGRLIGIRKHSLEEIQRIIAMGLEVEEKWKRPDRRVCFTVDPMRVKMEAISPIVFPEDDDEYPEQDIEPPMLPYFGPRMDDSDDDSDAEPEPPAKKYALRPRVIKRNPQIKWSRTPM